MSEERKPEIDNGCCVSCAKANRYCSVCKDLERCPTGLDAQLEAKDAKIGVMDDALSYYADPKIQAGGTPLPGIIPSLAQDRGDIAREARNITCTLSLVKYRAMKQLCEALVEERAAGNNWRSYDDGAKPDDRYPKAKAALERWEAAKDGLEKAIARWKEVAKP